MGSNRVAVTVESLISLTVIFFITLAILRIYMAILRKQVEAKKPGLIWIKNIA